MIMKMGLGVLLKVLNQLLKKKLEHLKKVLSQESHTSMLWLQLLSYIQIIKDFIRAERTGNWSLHLHSVRNMLNLFAATGHLHYAKCARLYLQQMIDLEFKFPHSSSIRKVLGWPLE